MTSFRCIAMLLIAGLVLGAALPAMSAAEIAEAQKQFQAGQYDECLAGANAALKAGEAGEEWLQLKIKSQLSLGRYPDALREIDTLLGRFRASLPARLLAYEVYRHNGDPKRGQELLEQIASLATQNRWSYSDAANRVTIGRAALILGTDPRQVLEFCYDRARKDNVSFRETYLASGELALDKHDFKVAADAFAAGVKLHPNDADLQFGLYRAFASSNPERAEAALRKALELNPNHVAALLSQVDDLIDAESYAAAEELLMRIWLVNPWRPEAWAYRAVIAHLQSDARCEEIFREVALRYWPTNPAVDHLIGKKLSQKYRFAEGSARQRQALEFEPKYVPARIQLSQDLLRLGQEEEGWRLAGEVNQIDGYDTVAYNLVTLQDNLKKFRTLENADFSVRMESREAAIYGPRVVQLLHRAKSTLCEKYGLALEGRVIVEIFHQQNDFAVRTFGMPGGAGFLGVCFGRVITANSPASQGKSPSNWEAVLWHEFCHVVTLELTRNKMPRWLSEGISVYEERQANPNWGQTMTPRYREMVLGGELTPVGKLSGAFLSPKTPQHLQFAYYESSLVVEYIIGRHGFVALKRILMDLGGGVPINEALGRHTGSLAELEQEFEAFAKQRAMDLGPKADWEKPDFTETRNRKAALLEFLLLHPNNAWALTAHANQLVADEDWPAAKRVLARLIDLETGFTGGDDPYRSLAHVHRKLDATDEEVAALEQLAERENDAVDAHLRLLELATLRSDWPAASRNARRLLAVNPLLPQGHRALARAGEETNDAKSAIEAYRTLLLFDPTDPADVHFRLARLLESQGDVAAKRHVLQSLEEAPRFRAAQQLLLKIVQDTGND